MKTYRRSLLKTLNHMKSRCYNENDKRYYDWGGRGVDICPKWLENPDEFVSWSLENGYAPGLSIDRIDNNKGYSPDNCRWVTLAENNQNRRSSKLYSINGKTQNLQQWCNEYSISRGMVNRRLEMGWDIEKALTVPKRTRDTQSLIGKRFGKLVVIEATELQRNRLTLWLCKCDCGNTALVDKNKLLSGHTASCGCYRKETCKKLTNSPR